MQVDFKFAIGETVHLKECDNYPAKVTGLFIGESGDKYAQVRWYTEGGDQNQEYLREDGLNPSGGSSGE